MHVEKHPRGFFQEVEKVAIIKKSNMVGNFEFCLILSPQIPFIPLCLLEFFSFYAMLI